MSLRRAVVLRLDDLVAEEMSLTYRMTLMDKTIVYVNVKFELSLLSLASCFLHTIEAAIGRLVSHCLT